MPFSKLPRRQGALLARSVVGGEATETSDLDIVVLDAGIRSAFRESRYEHGWTNVLHQATSEVVFVAEDEANGIVGFSSGAR